MSAEHTAAAAAAPGAATTGDKASILSAITTLKSSLAYFIEPDFGLLDHLLGLHVMDLRQLTDIRSERTVFRRNDALLDLLTSEDQCVKFMKALQRAGQQHVVNFVTQNGDIGAEFGDIRPLGEAGIHTLTVNGGHVSDLIEADVSFVTELANAGCITWSQREHLNNILQPRDRNVKLIEFLTRRSVAHFKKFINVLAKEQPQLVPVFLSDGAVPSVDAEIEGSSVNDVNHCEERIVSQWREVAEDEQHELCGRVDEILRPLGFQTSLLVIRRANSIALYFFCMTLLALTSLRDLWRSRQLRDIVEELFTLLTRTNMSVNRLTWPATDYDRCLQFFSSFPDERGSNKAGDLSGDTTKSLAVKSRSFTNLSDLPLEMMESVLTRAFLMLYPNDFERDDDESPVILGKSRSAERQAFRMLSSVCSHWYQTLIGWPESPTSQWVKHQLKKLIERSCHPFQRSAQIQHMYELLTVVMGVTQLHDVVYIVCRASSAILRFNATTHQRLTDIHVKGLNSPSDIVACDQRSQLYVADSGERVWRVSADGVHIKIWLPKSSTDTFTPYTLSVTSTRLLVTSRFTKQLIQLDSVGNYLRRVQLPDHMEPRHAVESPTTTLIVSLHNMQLKQRQISEVNMEGQVLRHFIGSRLASLGSALHLAIDSHGNVFVADFQNSRILLLDAQLTLRRVIIDEHQLHYKWPWCLCYREQTGQLLVGLYEKNVAVFDILRR